jgi:periplasmic protein TonB
MKRLQQNRIEILSKYLQTTRIDPALFPEILDHLSCEAEERLWDGKSFDQAYHGIVGTADAETLLLLSAETKYLLAMEKSLNDIVFEGRNKLYGAYALRKGYKQTVQRSLILGVSLFLLMVMLPELYARLMPELKSKDIAYIVEAKPINITLPKVPEPARPLPEPPKVVEKLVKSLSIEVLPDEVVVTEATLPTLDELADANPGPVTQEGTKGILLIEPSAVKLETLSGSIAPPKHRVEEEVTYAEEAPSFVGGMAGLASFLQRNLRYPREASKVGVEGRVFVQFTVGSDGSIENVRAIKGIGFGCDEEAERVVKMMPSWKPGKQSGRAVRVRYTLPVLFQLN